MEAIQELCLDVSQSATYKPGSFVSVRLRGHGLEELTGVIGSEFIEVYVSITTVDTRDPERHFRLGTTRRIPTYPLRSMLADGNKDEAVRFLRSEVRHTCHDLETHEADEFLRFNGEQPFDPHQKGL